MVRHYQWKRGDDGYLTKSMVEVDANETWVYGSHWRKCWKSTLTISGGSLKRFTTLQIVWPCTKLWFTPILAKTINHKIKLYIRKNKFQCAYFSPHAHIIKMVNCQSQLPPRRAISRELNLYCVSIKCVTHSLEKLNQQIKTVCILQAMCVPRNFDYAMFLAFLRIYNQILLSLQQDPSRERPDG